jgi:hypothetical protein
MFLWISGNLRTKRIAGNHFSSSPIENFLLPSVEEYNLWLNQCQEKNNTLLPHPTA